MSQRAAILMNIYSDPEGEEPPTQPGERSRKVSRRSAPSRRPLLKMSDLLFLVPGLLSLFMLIGAGWEPALSYLAIHYALVVLVVVINWTLRRW